MQKGYVSIILHAHLPFIRHPEHESFFEERWLFEAITEVYIPLLDVFDKLKDDGISFNLTMSLTPTLLSMLSDPLLQERYIRYAKNQLELCGREKLRTAGQPELQKLALLYEEAYENSLAEFEVKYSRNLAAAFKAHQDSGNLEIIACAATHGFLPLLGIHKESVRAQITTGVKCYEKYFGRKPRGIWLPECGYFPGVEASLKENGIEYFLLETHGIRYAEPRPIYDVYSPVVTPNGLAAFGRDPESSRQVWSSGDGYPGDYAYRDYYRDIGFDLDYEYVKNYISPSGQRSSTGMKYHRISGKTDEKLVYDRTKALVKAEIHAADFIDKKTVQLTRLQKVMKKPPIIVCPYDAELFGHWWYEGPHWLYSFIKGVSAAGDFSLTTPGRYLSENPVMQLVSPCTSSWGNAGYNDVWLNKSNDWIYRPLFKAAQRMIELTTLYPAATGLTRDALNQSVRELLLAQSSDWAFIMKAGTLTEYARNRTNRHLENFNRLYEEIKSDKIDYEMLNTLIQQDNLFPEMDYHVFEPAEVKKGVLEYVGNI
ncbi:MAG: DUF1957 domain-containing protein [Clostridiales bacterium]|nr:DUF1957 domain-containing protein [Clostridiales bacterium]